MSKDLLKNYSCSVIKVKDGNYSTQVDVSKLSMDEQETVIFIDECIGYAKDITNQMAKEDTIIRLKSMLASYLMACKTMHDWNKKNPNGNMYHNSTENRTTLHKAYEYMEQFERGVAAMFTYHEGLYFDPIEEWEISFDMAASDHERTIILQS